MKQPGASNPPGIAGAVAPERAAGAIPPNRPHVNVIPAQRGPSTARGIVFDPVKGQFVNAPNPAPGAAIRQTPATPERTAGSAGQLPAQVSPGGMGGAGSIRTGQPAVARSPFQDEIMQPHSGPALPAGAHSRPESRPSDTPGSGGPAKSPTTGFWGVPKSPDRSTTAPAASPRSTSSPSGSTGGTTPHSTPMRDMGSSGFGRGGGSTPSSPGGATGTYGGGHGGGSVSGVHPSR